MKKIIFSLLILPLIFYLGSFFTSQKANAQISGCNNIVITKENTGSVANLGDAKIYKLTITNRNATTCAYTFKGTGFNGEIWNFTFYKFYSNGSLSQAITGSNALSVGANGKKGTFFALVNPGTETKKNPGDKLVKIQSNTSGATEYEILTFTISENMACKTRAYECGRFQYDGKPYTCNNTCTSNESCNSSNKCVSNAPPATKDLTVSAFTFPGGVDTGTSDPIVKIKNQGNTQITGDFNVKVVNRDGGASKIWTVTQAVSPGEVIDLSSRFVNMPRPAAGTHTANAFVDSAGNISETNEGNNFKTDSYTTTKPDSNPKTKPPTNPPSPTCDKNPPTLEITPNNRNGNPGDEKEYDVKVINNDKGASCNPVDFVLSKERLPSNNWEGTFADRTLSNIPKGGGSKSTNFRLKSPTGATVGQKTFTIGVRRASQTSAVKQVNAYYTVTAETPVSEDPTPRPSTPPTGEPTNEPSARPTNGPTPSTCVRKTPEMKITKDKDSVRPGGKVITYTVKVKNMDQGPCAKRTMNLTRNLHNDNWTGAWDPNNDFEFLPGQARTKNLKVTSPERAPVGTYKVKINLRNNSNVVVTSQEVDFIISETPLSPTPIPSGEPTNTPSESPSVTPDPEKTYLNMVIGIDGIGTTPRVPLGGNKNPNSIFRGLNFKIYNTATNTLSFTGTNITFTYNQNSEKFELLYDLPSVENLPNGSYNIYVDGPGYLTNQYPGSFSITQGQVTDLTSNNFYLITGNVNNSDLSENRIDLMDYNLLLSCSVYSQDRSACDAGDNNERYTDLNDDGIVNEDDYTLFLKEFANQQGVILPE